MVFASRRRASPIFSLGGLLLLALYLGTVIRAAWIGDDGFITLRTVEHFASGLGMRWNVSERVQSFTHPLWMFMLAAARWATGDLYFTTLAVAIAVSLATVGAIARRVLRSPASLAFCLFALAMSRAYVDYSTSGLENPLTHLLVALFFAVWSAERAAPLGVSVPRARGFSPGRPSMQRVTLLAFVAGLSMTNRMDTALLFAPALAVEAWFAVRAQRVSAATLSRCAAAIALGMLPFVAWELFSLVYYGVFVPNTALAKLNTAVDSAALLRQGRVYYLDSLRRDPVTLGVIGAAIVAVVLGRRWREIPLLLGVLLYGAYIWKVGGDFMSGRFFTAPFLVSVLLLSVTLERARRRGWRALFAFALVAIAAIPGRLGGIMDEPAPKDRHQLIVDGVADERRFYPDYGLFRAIEEGSVVRRKLPPPPPGTRKAIFHGAVGFVGASSPSSVHIIDVLALTDPLLARLPCHGGWRIGHYGRVVPHGYRETVETGRNVIQDPNLHAFWEKLQVVISGPLFSTERFREIWRLNTGAYDHLVDTQFYRKPKRLELDAKDLANGRTNGRFDAAGNTLLYRNGARVRLDAAQRPRALDIALGCGTEYRIKLFRGRKLVLEKKTPTRGCRARTLSLQRVELRELPSGESFDRVEIAPIDETGEASLGKFALVP